MTTNFYIPVKAIRELPSARLDLLKPARCSRCNDPLAPYFETHNLKYRAGFVRNRTFSRKFQTIISLSLRLPLCEPCYQKNFIEAPETMDKDRNKIARSARWRSFGIGLASIFTGFAFILLMKIVSLPSLISPENDLWLYLIGIAVFIYGFTFGLVEVKNRQLKRSLLADNYDLSLHRATAEAALQAEPPNPEDIAVTIKLENDSWAGECASNYGWEYKLEQPQPEKEYS